MVDTGFIKPFVVGAVDTLTVQGGVAVEGGKPFLMGREPLPDVAIAGQVGLLSDKIDGSMLLCFDAKLFLKLMSNMLGEEQKQITPELYDGASELLNIVYCRAKKELNPMGYNFGLAIPTVVYGVNLAKLQRPDGMPHPATLVVPLQTLHGNALVEISVSNRKSA